MSITVSASMLTALQTALENNALSVSHNGKTVTFENFDQLRQRIEWIERRLATTTERPRQVLMKRRAD